MRTVSEASVQSSSGCCERCKKGAAILGFVEVRRAAQLRYHAYSSVVGFFPCQAVFGHNDPGLRQGAKEPPSTMKLQFDAFQPHSCYKPQAGISQNWAGLSSTFVALSRHARIPNRTRIKVPSLQRLLQENNPLPRFHNTAQLLDGLPFRGVPT